MSFPSKDLLHCGIGIDKAFLHLLVEPEQRLVLLELRHDHGHETLLQQPQQLLPTLLAATDEELAGVLQGLSMPCNSIIEFGYAHIIMCLGSQHRGVPPVIAGMHMDEHA